MIRRLILRYWRRRTRRLYKQYPAATVHSIQRWSRAMYRAGRTGGHLRLAVALRRAEKRFR